MKRDGDSQIVALHKGPSAGPGAEQTYAYDSLQRLTDVASPYGWFGDHYAYDAVAFGRIGGYQEPTIVGGRRDGGRMAGNRRFLPPDRSRA